MSSAELRPLYESSGLVFEMEEIWKPIEGYEGKYEVSNLGRVMSLNYLSTKKPRIMKPFKVISRHGFVPYLQVDLFNEGTRKSVKVHILVCTAFHGHRPSDIDGDTNIEAMHLNGNSLDNRAENLAWGRHSDNVREKNFIEKQAAAQRRRWASGEYEYQKKAVIQLAPNGDFVAKYDSAWDAQRATGCNQSDISKHCRGIRKWLVGGFRWKFEKDYNGTTELSTRNN